MARKPNAGGRASKLTEKMARAICEHIRRGRVQWVAAVLEGVSADTMTEWMARGEGRPGRRGGRGTTDAHAQFARAVRAAEAEAHARLSDVVLKHACGLDGRTEDPKLALEALARRWPDDWGRRDRVENKTEVTGGPGVLSAVLILPRNGSEPDDGVA